MWPKEMPKARHQTCNKGMLVTGTVIAEEKDEIAEKEESWQN